MWELVEVNPRELDQVQLRDVSFQWHKRIKIRSETDRLNGVELGLCTATIGNVDK